MFVKTPVQLPSHVAIPRLPGHFQSKTSPGGKRSVPDHTHNSQVPLGLPVWLSADIYSVSSAEFKKSASNPHYTLLHPTLFIFVVLFRVFFSVCLWVLVLFFGCQAPRRTNLPHLPLSALLSWGKTHGRKSTKRSLPATGLFWFCAQGNESAWVQKLVQACCNHAVCKPWASKICLVLGEVIIDHTEMHLKVITHLQCASGNFYMMGKNIRKVKRNPSSGGLQPENPM